MLIISLSLLSLYESYALTINVLVFINFVLQSSSSQSAKMNRYATTHPHPIYICITRHRRSTLLPFYQQCRVNTKLSLIRIKATTNARVSRSSLFLLCFHSLYRSSTSTRNIISKNVSMVDCIDPSFRYTAASLQPG